MHEVPKRLFKMEAFDAVLFDLFGTLVTERGEAIEGARTVLERMHGRRWAIVTSCPRALAQALIDRAGLPAPPLIVSSEDVQRGKPAPDCYLLAAERLGVAAERCLVLEDSRHGVAAATAAGMTVVEVGRTRALRDVQL